MDNDEQSKPTYSVAYIAQLLGVINVHLSISGEHHYYAVDNGDPRALVYYAYV